MQARNWFRGLWSRQTLAAKLTISYTAALLLIAVVVAVIAGFAVVIELRRASIDAAARAAETTAMAIEETVEAYHNSFLLTKVEAATQVLGQLNPQSDRDSAIAYVASHDQETKGFLFLLDQSGQIIYHPQGADSALDMGTIDAASQIATSGPGFHRYTGQSRESGDRAVYHSYSAPVPRSTLRRFSTKPGNKLQRPPNGRSGPDRPCRWYLSMAQVLPKWPCHLATSRGMSPTLNCPL